MHPLEQRGGHFRVGIGGGSTADSLDPATYGNSFMQGIGGAHHSVLTEVGPDGSLEPALATEWEASPAVPPSRGNGDDPANLPSMHWRACKLTPTTSWLCCRKTWPCKSLGGSAR